MCVFVCMEGECACVRCEEEMCVWRGGGDVYV